jgi:hypothetical protein
MKNLMPVIDSDRFISPRQCLSLILIMLLFGWHLPAQERNKPAIPRPSGLKIFVLAGNGAVNYIPDGHGTTPVVEIRDDNGYPVSGAALEFRLSETGPGGDFPNGQHMFSAVTNTAGQAEAPFTIRPLPGSFTMQISAKIDTRSVSASITQVNTLKASEVAKTTAKAKHWYKNWKILAIAGAGVVVVVVVLATRGGSNGPSGTTVGLAPGAPTFGAPH